MSQITDAIAKDETLQRIANALDAKDTTQQRINEINEAAEVKKQEILEMDPLGSYQNVSNALKGTATGEIVVLPDVSPLEDTLDVVVKNKDESGNDLSEVVVYTTGKNLFNMDKYSVITYGGTRNTEGHHITFAGNAGSEVMASSGQLKIKIPQAIKTAGMSATISFYITILEAGANSLRIRLLYGVNDTMTGHVTHELPIGERTKYVATIENMPTDLDYIALHVNSHKVLVEMDTLQIEHGNTPTEYQTYITPIEYRPNSDGVVEGLIPIYPTTTIYTNTDNIDIKCRYNRDVNYSLAKLYERMYDLHYDQWSLYGKRVLSFGDSIAWGTGNNEESYAHIIAQKNEMSLFNMAKGGATMSRRTDGSSNSISVQVDDAIANYQDDMFDFILLEGGTNDAKMSTLGDIITDYDVSTCDDNTFTGALEINISKLRNAWWGANLIYVIVHKMTYQDKDVEKAYHDRIVEVCEKWCIPYVDIYKSGQITSYIDVLTSNCFPEGSVVHPNRIGYEKFYVPPIVAKMKELI